MTTLIIVTGPPASGKTTLGKRIAQEFHLPFVSRDAIKEKLFDSLGWSDREWSRKLGRASYDLLYYFAEVQLAAGRSHIIESNFDARYSTGKLLELKAKYTFAPLQIHCNASDEALRKRFKRRWEAGERHPGHVQHLDPDVESGAWLRSGMGVLDIGGPVVEVDTTDFGAVDYDGLFAVVQSVLDSRG